MGYNEDVVRRTDRKSAGGGRQAAAASVKGMENVFEALNRFFAAYGKQKPDISAAVQGLPAAAAGIYTLAARWLLPALAVLIVLRCVLPLLGGRKKETPWGYLAMPNGVLLPLLHGENSIGRSRLSDVVINLPFISRSHAVLTYGGGSWTVFDLGARGGIRVNGERVEGRAPVKRGDTISLSGLDLTLFGADDPVADENDEESGGAGRPLYTGTTLALIAVFQVMGCLQLLFSGKDGSPLELLAVFGVFLLTECLDYWITGRKGSDPELKLLAYFLCGIGLFVVASASSRALYKQLAAILIGVAAYSVMAFLIRDLDRAQKLKKGLLAAALVLMALNLVIGQTRNGAKNWIDLGAFTFQPMEFVKIAFVLAGAATLDRLLTTRNLTAFIAFSGACIGTLALTKDFGTALVFFCAFLVIAFMRSGDIRTIALISAGAVLAAIAVVAFMPYVTARFSVWGHVWQHADSTGYQQTRTMIALASGGLLGVGGGNGYLAGIGAADTDLAFGVIGEEWGLVIALAVVLAIAFLTFFALSSVKRCRSSFYAIAACGASVIFLMQTALNVLGSVDILPLTGVTMPFVSNGGSSMVTCWCLLAFVRSADERFRPDLARIPEADDGGEERKR